MKTSSSNQSVLLVEWPDRGGRLLPSADLVLDFGETAASRFIECTARTSRGAAVAGRVLQQLS